MKTVRERLRVLALLTVLVASGCAFQPPPSWLNTDTASDPDWVLSIGSPRVRWAADEPIETMVVLRYVGPGGQTEWFGSSSGPIWFELQELAGRRDLQGGLLLDCKRHFMRSADPLVTPFEKHLGYDGNDPNVAWIRAFLADPELRLPAGQWELGVQAIFSMPPGCGEGRVVSLHASITLTVE